MKNEDKVVCNGDHWMTAGSIGTIRAYKSATSVLVKWEKVAVGSRHKPGVALYHQEINLTLLKDGIMDPNIAFMVKRQT